LVQPAALLDQLLGAPGVRRVSGQVHRLLRTPDGWLVRGADEQVLAEGDIVVLAAAAAVPAILRASGVSWQLGERMSAVAGQLNLLDAAWLRHGGPRCVVAGEGSVLPAVQGRCVVGSTYDRDAAVSEPAPVRAEGCDENLRRLQTLLPGSL